VATMTQPAPTRTKTTIFKETLPPEDRAPADAQPSPFYARDWETVVNELTQDQWAGHIMRVYRADEKWDRSSSPIDNTFSGPFTEEDMRQRFGGGKYLLWLYGPPKKHNLVGRYQVSLDGQPIVNGTPRQAAGTDGNSVALQALQMMNSPEIMRMQFEMMRNAALSVIELMKSQMPAAQDPLQTLRNAKEILGVGAPSADSSLITHITLLKELGLIGSPEKKGITEVLETLNAFKTAGLIPSAVPKADIGSMFAANLPMLADRLVNGLKEFRLQAESTERTIRLQRGELRAGDPTVIDVQPSAPAAVSGNTAAADTAAAAATAAATVTPEQAQAIIAQSHLHRIAAGIKNPKSTGQDLYDYLVNAWPEILDELAKMDKGTLLAFFKNRDAQKQYFGADILAEVGDDPRLPQIIEDFLKIAKENGELEKAATSTAGVV
jgi:hypothetical protein